jgi:hypothetical protein
MYFKYAVILAFLALLGNKKLPGRQFLWLARFSTKIRSLRKNLVRGKGYLKILNNSSVSGPSTVQVQKPKLLPTFDRIKKLMN